MVRISYHTIVASIGAIAIRITRIGACLAPILSGAKRSGNGVDMLSPYGQSSDAEWLPIIGSCNRQRKRAASRYAWSPSSVAVASQIGETRANALLLAKNRITGDRYEKH